MNKHELTGLIKEKGWTVKDFLDHIGRSYPWYHDNCNGTDKQRLRLKMLIDGMPIIRNALDRDEEDGYWEVDSRGEFGTRKLKDGRVWFKQLKRSRK